MTMNYHFQVFCKYSIYITLDLVSQVMRIKKILDLFNVQRQTITGYDIRPFIQRQSYCEHCTHNQQIKHCDSNIICMSVCINIAITVIIICMSVIVCMNVMSNDVILFYPIFSMCVRVTMYVFKSDIVSQLYLYTTSR